MKTRLKKGEDFVSTFSYPTWEQLPELDLYLDQVLLYVNKTCAPVLSSSDKGLTAAMINNYVKHGYVEKPDKKKYQRRQVARLIAITTLKTVFSIQEIASTLNFLQDQAAQIFSIIALSLISMSKKSRSLLSFALPVRQFNFILKPFLIFNQ